MHTVCILYLSVKSTEWQWHSLKHTVSHLLLTLVETLDSALPHHSMQSLISSQLTTLRIAFSVCCWHFLQKFWLWACSSCLGALCSSLSCLFSSFHYLSFGLLLPPSRTIFDVLEPSFHQQLQAGASMCSAWWAASGCWSFSPYPSPPFSLLFSSLYSASWPPLRFSASKDIQK